LGFDVWDGFFGGPFFVFAEVLGLSLDSFAGFVLIIFFVFFFFEVFAVPGIFAERGLVYRFGIDDYSGFDDGFEVDAFQVGRCGLQGIEQQAGGFGIDLSAQNQAHDLHERDLDGVGVFENREIDGGASSTGAVGVQDDAGFLPAFMEETEMIAS
jgi:hypothetical protein